MALLKTGFAQRALRWQWLISFLKWAVPPIDKFLLRISRGWLSAAMQTIALLETTGAKSGQPRETVTLCMPDAEDIILVGSNWGREQHPAWIFNLRAQPSARVTFRGYCGAVVARELVGEEREETWQQLVVYNPQYAMYQATVERQLPIMRLSRDK